jgi:isochorismate synthase
LEQALLLKGFFVAPFEEVEGHDSYLIKPDIVLHSEKITAAEVAGLVSIPENTKPNEEIHRTEELTKEEYLDQISQTIGAIRKHEMEKVVLSRIKVVNGSYTTKLFQIFKLHNNSYPNAFVYTFNLSGQVWMGASPEPLMRTAHNNISTVALAGTRLFSTRFTELTNWPAKEKVEQHYVTRYISSVLQQFKIQHVNRTGPYTKRAGNLLHLRTDFSFPAHQVNGRLHKLITALHPSSSVCGMPKNEAMKWISRFEKQNRGYYSGYLGPVNMDRSVDFFVNLRCMQVANDALYLYVGGGITTESVPEDEWDETNIKAETLLSIINRV